MPEENLQQENGHTGNKNAVSAATRAVWGEFADVIMFCLPPAAMQRTIFVALAGIPALARLLRDVTAALAQCVGAARSRTHGSRLTHVLRWDHGQSGSFASCLSGTSPAKSGSERTPGGGLVSKGVP